MTARSSRKTRFALVATFCALAGSAGAGTMTIESFTPAQQQQFWSRLETLASVESGARTCGRPTGVEGRFREAVGPCLAPEAVNRVLATFRQKLGRASASAADCDGAAAYVATANRMVAEAAGMCRACLMTGLCK